MPIELDISQVTIRGLPDNRGGRDRARRVMALAEEELAHLLGGNAEAFDDARIDRLRQSGVRVRAGASDREIARAIAEAIDGALRQ